MRVCILGAGLSGLTFAQALVNKKIYVDVLFNKKAKKLNPTRTLGISKSNISKLKILHIKGFGGISYFQKKNRPFYRPAF